MSNQTFSHFELFSSETSGKSSSIEILNLKCFPIMNDNNMLTHISFVIHRNIGVNYTYNYQLTVDIIQELCQQSREYIFPKFGSSLVLEFVVLSHQKPNSDSFDIQIT